MKLDDAEILTSKCIKAAEKAWRDNFDLKTDSDREAIGRIADTFLNRVLDGRIQIEKDETK